MTAAPECLDCAQYVGTVLNKALGHELRIEVAAEDPAMVTWLTGDGHPPEDITKQFILKARNAYNMSSERLEDNLGRAGKLCHASERWGPLSQILLLESSLTQGPGHVGGQSPVFCEAVHHSSPEDPPSVLLSLVMNQAVACAECRL